MKRLLFLISMFLLNSIVSAQLVRGYGVKLGATIANQNWEYDNSLGVNFDPENRTGFNIGGFCEFLNFPLISLVTEINYVQKGMKEEIVFTSESSPESQGTVLWDTRIDYLNLSILNKIRINYIILNPYLIVGPKMDIELNQVRSKLNASVVEDEFNTIRFGLKLGIGTEINILPVTLLAEIIYDADFNELFENENLKVSSESFDIRVGVMF